MSLVATIKRLHALDQRLTPVFLLSHSLVPLPTSPLSPDVVESTPFTTCTTRHFILQQSPRPTLRWTLFFFFLLLSNSQPLRYRFSYIFKLDIIELGSCIVDEEDDGD